MKEDSNVAKIVIETSRVEGRPCGGALERKKKNSRRLVSTRDGRTVYVKSELLPPRKPEKASDPTAWYVVAVHRHKEQESVQFLTNAKQLRNERTDEEYSVEAYAAVQLNAGNKVVIHGKIFVRVDKTNRVDVLRKCPFLRGYVKDPSRSLTENNFTDFAQVPDVQMQALRAILDEVDAPIEYSSQIPLRKNDVVRLGRGILSKSEILRDLEGTVEIVNGKKRATVILDKIGVFKFTIPLSDLKRLK